MSAHYLMGTVDKGKLAAAEAAAALVEDGMIVGLGSGSTAALAVDAIGKRVAAGLRIVGIPTSEKTAEQARELGIPLVAPQDRDHIDMTIDGADEVEDETLDLVKGLGGALLREKIVASMTERFVIVADDSKLVKKIGQDRLPIPVEVVPFGWQVTARRLKAIGADWTERLGTDGKPFITDGGHVILDCRFDNLDSARSLQQRLDSMVGVVEHGLFLGMTSEVIVGQSTGEVLKFYSKRSKSR